MEKNPAPVEVGRLSRYLQGFIHPRWCRISSINSIVQKMLLHSNLGIQWNTGVSSFIEIDRVFSSQDLSCMELVYCLKPKLEGYEPKNGIPLGISVKGDAYLKIFEKPCHFI